MPAGEVSNRGTPSVSESEHVSERASEGEREIEREC